MIALRIILGGSHVIRGLCGLHKVTGLLSRVRAVGSVLAAHQSPLGTFNNHNARAAPGPLHQDLMG